MWIKLNRPPLAPKRHSTLSLTPPPPTPAATAPDRIPAVTPKEPPAPQVLTNRPNPRHAEIPGNTRRGCDAYGNPKGERTSQDNPMRDISRLATIPKVDI
ncbi:hypothetical protein IQ274_33645 [Nostoc sp. LEGE 12447]|uniref:hypothetical protein n=1 Tax=Nostoc sp. LEGE 12447 TaxID=1828640 RepID=UPI0018836C0B|nr:hypothetical protein [Nostoc sp. LEGE 12447]MBE9002993.1 hypothetical protein [Nostoc sp. LEGE 12447]